ncbi:MAG: ribbon-helix-helix domain-containing protein [Pseudolabrys sp.]
MKSAIVKRSVVLEGHKTSVSLENEFWEGLREIAEQQKSNLSSLVRQIDRDRTKGNLSSAIRVFVLNHFHAQAARAPSPERRPGEATWPTESARAG